MPVKKVVLCEGIHDVRFFELLLNQRGIRSRVITKNYLTSTRETSPETNAIRNFISPTKGRGVSYLLKDEGGNGHCIDNFQVIYEEKDSSFVMFLCLDGDSQNLRKLRRQTVNRFNEDILDQKSDNFHITKGRTKHAVFFIPDSLESQVSAIIGKNIDNLDQDNLKQALLEFIQVCREREIDWFLELEAVFFQREYTN